MQYYIGTDIKMGRGIYSLYNQERGSIIMTAQLLVLSPEDTLAIAKTQLSLYTFAFNDKQDCIALAHGSLFNHSDKPNVGYRLVTYPGEAPVIEFYVLRSIEPGQQCFIDYTADTAVDVSKYSINLDGQ